MPDGEVNPPDTHRNDRFADLVERVRSLPELNDPDAMRSSAASIAADLEALSAAQANPEVAEASCLQPVKMDQREPAIIDVIAGFDRLAARLALQPDAASKNLARAVRVWRSSKADDRFNFEAAIGVGSNWREQLAQQEALRILARKKFPNATAWQASRKLEAFLSRYHRVDWERDNRPRRKPNADNAEAFVVLNLHKKPPGALTIYRNLLSNSPLVSPPKADATFQASEQHPMALTLAKNRNTDTSAAARLQDDTAYAAAQQVVDIITERSNRLRREAERLRLEDVFAVKAPEADSANDRFLRQKLADLQAEPPLTPIPPTTREAATPAIAKALEAAAGGEVLPSLSLAEQLQRIEAEQNVLREGLTSAMEVRDEIAAELSTKRALAELPAWNRDQTELLEAARTVSRVMGRIGQREASIVLGGFTWRGHILRMPSAARTPRLLGSEDRFDSEISQWTRELQAMGIL
jgi:hypothetical protein